MDTIGYVYRTGRIPKVAATIGSILKIRPILTSSSGLIRFKGIARNKRRGINRLLETMRNEVGQSAVHVAVMHAYTPDDAEMLKDRISSEFNCAELWVTEVRTSNNFVHFESFRSEKKDFLHSVSMFY